MLPGREQSNSCDRGASNTMTITMPSEPHLLLVEDDPIVALATIRRLEELGYLMEHESSGEAALQRVRSGSFQGHLIIMDIDLGAGMDGTEAASQINEINDVPVLFLSSHTEPGIVQRTEQISSYGYVVKDSGFIVLDASIKMALKLFASRKEQKNQSELLEKSKLFYRLTLENVSDAVFLTDSDLNLTFVCPNAERIHGFTQKEIEDMHTLDALLGTGLREALKKLELHKVENIELAVDNPRKGKQHSSIDVRPVNIDQASLLFTCHDMTEHHRVREEIRESRALYRNLFMENSIPMALIECEKGTILKENKEFDKLLDTTSETLLGSLIFDHFSDFPKTGLLTDGDLKNSIPIHDDAGKAYSILFSKIMVDSKQDACLAIFLAPS